MLFDTAILRKNVFRADVLCFGDVHAITSNTRRLNLFEHAEVCKYSTNSPVHEEYNRALIGVCDDKYYG